MLQVEVSHKSEMAGPFNMGGTTIHVHKHLRSCNRCKTVHTLTSDVVFGCYLTLVLASL